MFAFFCILLLSQCLAVCLGWLEICDPLASVSGVLDYSSPCLALLYTFQNYAFYNKHKLFIRKLCFERITP